MPVTFGRCAMRWFSVSLVGFTVGLAFVFGGVGRVQGENIVFLAGEVDGFELPADPASPRLELRNSNPVVAYQDFDLIAGVNGGDPDTSPKTSVIFFAAI